MAGSIKDILPKAETGEERVRRVSGTKSYVLFLTF
jgi:hypothetical protein